MMKTDERNDAVGRDAVGGQGDAASGSTAGGSGGAATAAEASPSTVVGTAAEAVSDSSDLLGIKAYVPVLLDVIRTTDKLAFDIYVKHPERGFVPFRFRNTPLQERDRQQLLVRGVHQVYIDVRHHPDYCKCVEAQLDALIADASIQIEERARLLYQVADRLIEEMGCGLTAEHVKRARQLVRVLASNTLHSRALPEAMARLCVREHHVGAHVLHVCSGVMRVGLSMKLPVADLADLALAGILHDVGKTADVLDSRDLPASESDPRHGPYRGHPALGARAVQALCPKSAGLIAVVAQHHEALDGSGFPDGLKGPSIHPWARICAAVAAYDRLTMNAPDRESLAPDEAIKRIEAEAGTKYDPQVVEHLKRVLNLPSGAVAPGAAAALPEIGVCGPGGAERRQAQRFPFHVAVILRRGLDRHGRPIGRTSMVVQALDVSQGGIHFISKQPLGLGEEVLIDLPAQPGGKGGVQQVRAKIVRCVRWTVAAGYDIGAKFVCR